MALLGRSEVLATDDSSETKSTPQYLYFVIAAFAVLLMMAARLYTLRRRSRPVTEFFSVAPPNSYNNSQAPADLTFSSSYQPSRRMHLAPLPPVYRPDRRVNAADTDSAGRRIGGPDDLDWDGKDILPAYNKLDRPPKYDFGGVPPTEGYTAPTGNHPRDNTTVASTEVIPVENRFMASIRTGHSVGDDTALSTPRHES